MLLFLAGCASGAMKEARAPAADKVAKQAPGDAAGGKIEDEATNGLTREQIKRPDVLVARLGKRWGLPLEQVSSTAHRLRLAADLRWIEKRRARLSDPPPGRSWLYVARPGVYAVLVVPTAARRAPDQHAALYLWDFSGKARPCRVALALRPAARGSIARRRPVVRRGALWLRAYRLDLRKSGALAIRVHVDRGPGAKLLSQDQPVPVSTTDRPDQ